MNKIGLIALGLVVASLASAQVIYLPNRKANEQGISLKGWGSGTISETDEVHVDGAYSLQISTRNYFQGGSIMLAKPVDLSGAFADKNNLLRFAIRSSGEKPKFATTLGGGSTGGGPASQGAGTGGGLSGGEGAGGALGGGGGGRQGGGSTAPQGTSIATDAILRNVRVVVTTSDGLKSEAYLSVRATGAEAWRSFSLPLTAIHGFERTNKNVQAISVSGDAISTFWVGDIRVVNDTTPISAEVNFKNDLNLALGDEKEFVAYGFAGSTPLKYTWDFDDSDGIQVDAEGQSVKYKFRRPGTFKVTVTVSDAYGAKKPMMKTIKVVVNP